MTTLDDTTWRDDALCTQVGGDIFYPETGESARPAKSICARCDVRSQCLQYALDNHEEHRVWGGTTETDRRKLNRRSAA